MVLVALLFASVSLQAAPYDPPTWRDSTWDYRSEDSTDLAGEVSWVKVGAVASLTLIAYGAAYWLVFDKGWWDEQGNHFHFENDFDYALNLDKFGHQVSLRRARRAWNCLFEGDGRKRASRTLKLAQK